MDAHVTADATEQWIQVALRRGVAFDPHAIALMVPDCGYKLRRIEVEATGRLSERRFLFESNGQSVDLTNPAANRGHGHIRGHFEAPSAPTPMLALDAFVAQDSR